MDFQEIQTRQEKSLVEFAYCSGALEAVSGLVRPKRITVDFSEMGKDFDHLSAIWNNNWLRGFEDAARS